MGDDYELRFKEGVQSAVSMYCLQRFVLVVLRVALVSLSKCTVVYCGAFQYCVHTFYPRAALTDEL